MRGIFLAAGVATAGLLAGCAAPAYNYVPATAEFSIPPVGEVATRSIGERMLIQGVSTEGDAIRIRQAQKLGAYTIHPGAYMKIGEEGNFEFYGQAGGGKITSGSLNYQDPLVSIRTERGGEDCFIGLASFTACGSLDYDKVTHEVADEQSFQQTLIYSGKSGNEITLTYREFSGEMARDAFSNRAQYDLSESDIVGYQGARIRVIEADNSSITYEVLTPFERH